MLSYLIVDQGKETLDQLADTVIILILGLQIQIEGINMTLIMTRRLKIAVVDMKAEDQSKHFTSNILYNGMCIHLVLCSDLQRVKKRREEAKEILHPTLMIVRKT